MFALLEQEWRARRAVVLLADAYPGIWVCALLRALGVQVIPVSEAVSLTSETLCRILSKRRPCAVILPQLDAQGEPPEAFRQLDALHLLLSECRESGLRALIMLSQADAYQARPGMRVREEDPLGGESAAGGLKSLLETYALGFSRGLYGDPAAVILARHPPLTGGGMDQNHFAARWCAALSHGEMLQLPTPGLLYPFMHPLEAAGGALLCGAMLLRHGVQYAGAWNFAPGIASLATCRSAASCLRDYAGGNRPIQENSFPIQPRSCSLDDHRARERLGYRSAFDARQVLSMLYDYHVSVDKEYTLDTQAEAYLRALEETKGV